MNDSREAAKEAEACLLLDCFSARSFRRMESADEMVWEKVKVLGVKIDPLFNGEGAQIGCWLIDIEIHSIVGRIVHSYAEYRFSFNAASLDRLRRAVDPAGTDGSGGAGANGCRY